MTETIESSALPEHWNVVYEVAGVHNVCETRFEQKDASTTLIEQRNVFRFSGFMRVVGVLFGLAIYMVPYRPMAGARGNAVVAL